MGGYDLSFTKLPPSFNYIYQNLSPSKLLNEKWKPLSTHSHPIVKSYQTIPTYWIPLLFLDILTLILLIIYINI